MGEWWCCEWAVEGLGGQWSWRSGSGGRGSRWSWGDVAKPHPHLFDDVGEAPLREVVHPLHPEADDSAPRPLGKNVGEALKRTTQLHNPWSGNVGEALKRTTQLHDPWSG